MKESLAKLKWPFLDSWTHFLEQKESLGMPSQVEEVPF